LPPLDREAPGEPPVLPYCEIVAQKELRRALEIAHISPNVGGVLASGHRGTAKSTTVRSFTRMATGRLPVTLPIGATDDRVLGGWRVEALMASRPRWQRGLIEEAGDGHEPGMLYIDEVNLLDAHLTNIILDVASTGLLVVQREGAARKTVKVRFSLVGTMNPEEGSLRPQLLDRFGLVVLVKSADSDQERKDVLRAVLRFEECGADPGSGFLAGGYHEDHARRKVLAAARLLLPQVKVPDDMLDLAARIAGKFKLEGHRGELAMLRAARALVALKAAEAEATAAPKTVDGDETAPLEVGRGHLAEMASSALVHRRATSDSGTMLKWSADDEAMLTSLTGTEPS
jgi:magnesium chelatase subunit I